MTDLQSVCLYHNGNSRILQQYKAQFLHLQFCGNWAEATDHHAPGCLWEICYADATVENLMQATASSVHVLRHISTYQDDLENLLPECEHLEYADWLTHVVTDNLCFADQVVSDLLLESSGNPCTVIITTGRTANTHLQEVYKSHGRIAFEGPKSITNDLLSAHDAVLLWRQDQWQCLSSTWIAKQTFYKKSHQLANKSSKHFDVVKPIDINWICQDWMNICKITLDQALLSKYVCNRPTSYTTTAEITKKFLSVQVPLSYNKRQLIPNYEEVESWYKQSTIASFLELRYNKVIKHLTPWSIS